MVCMQALTLLVGMCRWLDADGSKQMGSAWQKPEQVLHLPEGIRSVAAGMHSSAAVSRDGQLWLWGKVISKVCLTVLLRWGSVTQCMLL